MHCSRYPRLRQMALGAALLAAAVAGPPAAEAAARPDVPLGEHGAAKMDFQLQELAKLQPDADVTQTPAGLDPVIWEAFIPRDNELSARRVANIRVRQPLALCEIIPASPAARATRLTCSTW